MNLGHFYIELTKDSLEYKNELNRTYIRQAMDDKVFLVLNWSDSMIIGKVMFIDTNNDLIVVETDNSQLFNKKILGKLIPYKDDNGSIKIQDTIYCDISSIT